MKAQCRADGTTDASDRPLGERVDRPRTLPALLLGAYRAWEHAPALRVDSRTVTFGELARVVIARAVALAEQGLRPGDRVVLGVDNSVDLIVADHAIWLAGAIRVSLGGRVHGRELARVVTDCTPHLVLCHSRHLDQAGPALRAALPPGAVLEVVAEEGDPVAGWWSPAAAAGPVPASPTELLAVAAQLPGPATVGPGDPAALMYTSGTSGTPRAAVATHGAWAAMTGELGRLLPQAGPGDLYGHLAPMSHLSGSVAHAMMLRGVAGVVPAPGEARSAAVFDRHRITMTTVVPAQLRRFAASVLSGAIPMVGSLRAVVYGGAAPGPDLVRRSQWAFGPIAHQVYGSSEAMVPLTWLSPRDLDGEDVDRRSSSAGRVTAVCELVIRTADGQPAVPGAVGEVVVRGPTVSPGYRRPDGTVVPVTDPAGWYGTGDVGFLDRSGYLTLTGRARELIVTGGFTVYPGEVESAILTLPGVAECVVCAVPHLQWGEGVAAVVRLHPGASLDAADVVAVCRSQLASHKKPVLVRFVDRLPETASGKTDRAAVRAQFWTGHTRLIGLE